MAQLKDFFVYYPQIDTDDFESNLMSKKEFIELPTLNHDKYFAYQLTITRFLAAKTPYNGLLIAHQMGSGKTCTAISVIENNKTAFRGAIICAPSENLLGNFKNELVFKCTNGEYLPDDFEELSEEQKITRINKKTAYYTFDTFEKFAKHLAEQSDATMNVQYDNHMFVLDEAHTLVFESVHYQQMWRLLHLCPNSKIMLLTGTPIIDGVNEIAYLMNLILPEDQQLPTREADFVRQCLTKTGRGNHRLQRAFRGRVSYLKATQNEVKKNYLGEVIGKLEYLPVVVDVMSPNQSAKYMAAYTSDKSETGAIYSRSRIADLATITADYYKIRKDATGKRVVTLNAEYADRLRPLANLQQVSSKYAALIPSLEQAFENKRCTFVYSTSVTGPGLDFLTLLLELYGWTSATGSEKKKGKRFIYLNNTLTRTALLKLIERFNQPDNLYGEYIHLIIGSELIATGFSFFNVQQVEVLTPHWNMKKLLQAVSRGARINAHKALIDAGVTPTYDINLRVSLPGPERYNESVSLYMYELSERKDIAIGKIERDLEEYSFDCMLNYDQNYTPGNDMRPECQYLPCEYRCMGEVHPTIDYSSYNLVYASDHIKQLVQLLVAHFEASTPPWSLESLTPFMPAESSSQFILLCALEAIINMEITLKHHYILKEHDNIYCLVPYDHPDFKYYDFTFDTVLYSSQNQSDLIDDMGDVALVAQLFSQPIKEATKLFFMLPRIVQIIVFEQINTNPTKYSPQLTAMINNFFSNFTDMTQMVHWMHYPTIFKLNSGKWEDITNTQLGAQYTDRVQERQKTLETNPYRHYGQYSRVTNSFCIRRIDVESKKKHMQTSGKRCQNWDRGELLDLLINIFKFELPATPEIHMHRISKLSVHQLQTEVAAIANFTPRSPKSQRYLQTVLYYHFFRTSKICQLIYAWFDEHDLLIEDPTCGMQGKPKSSILGDA